MTLAKNLLYRRQLAEVMTDAAAMFLITARGCGGHGWDWFAGWQRSEWFSCR